MSKFFKAILLIGIVVVIFGGVLLGIAIGTRAFAKDETVSKEEFIEEVFNSFDIDLAISDLKFEKSDVNKVACNERKKHYHEVKVENEKLVITFKDDYKWYENILKFDYKPTSVTVYLTEENYDNLHIESSTGDIVIPEDFTFNSADIKVSTGDVDFKANCLNDSTFKASTGDIIIDGINNTSDIKVETSTGSIKLKNTNCKNVNLKASTGKVTLENTLVEEHAEIKTSTGNVVFTDADANTLNVITSTGSVKGNLKTGKNFETETSTGKVSVPTGSTGGLCHIKTSTGDIKIEVK